MIQRNGKALLKVIRRAKDAEPIDPTEIKITKKWVKESVLTEQDTSRRTLKQKNRYNKLLFWRKNIAEQRKVDASIIVPNDILFEISKENPSNIRDLRKRPGFGKWRINQYGEEIIATLKAADSEFTCFLCGNEFAEREMTVSCPFCKTRFHLKEFSEYLARNLYCPNCDEALHA